MGRTSLCLAVVLMVSANAAHAEQVLAGLWRSGTDANYFSVGKDLSSFVTLANQRHKKGLRLVDLDTHVVGGKRKWAGVWRSGTYANYFSVNQSLSSFISLANARHKKGLRLIDLETYEDEGRRLWAGVWRSGTYANYFSVNRSLSSFISLANARHKKGLRLIDLETYELDGQRVWAGVWSSGSYANYFSVNKSLSSFTALANARHKKGLRLVDLETYKVNGQRVWAGVWRSGKDANYFSVGKYFESFLALANYRHKKSLRLVDLEIYDEPCGDTFDLPFENTGGWALWNGNWDEPTSGHNLGNPNGLQAYAFDFVHDADNDGVGESGPLIRAARGGIVYDLEEAEWGNSWGAGNPPGYNGVGNYLVIDHQDGTFGTYFHLQQFGALVNVGDTVSRGDAIGINGNTGNSSTAHIHFEARTDWSLGYPGDGIEFPSIRIRFRDKAHKCWVPRVGDPLAPLN